MSVPAGSSLTPPATSPLPERPDGASWAEERIYLPAVEAGDLAAAQRFIIHVSLSVQRPRFRLLDRLADGSHQGQIRFDLSGWRLVLAPVDDPRGDSDFGAVVEATPPSSPVTVEEIDKLTRRLFYVLSLASSHEVGVSPVCGLDDEDRLTWAQWAPPRLRPGRSAAGWCSGHLLPEALPALAEGFDEIASDAALEAVVGRAIEHLLSADSTEVVDVRIPVACSGLELLSWAILRRHGRVSQDTFRQLTAGGAARLLVQWAAIAAELPDGFNALAARKGRLGRDDWEAPELLFNVRNGVIHLPKKIEDPEWPRGEELVETWQLATWYLQLVLLRILGYRGEYWSRLRLGRSEMDVEPVPWAPRG